MCIFYYSIEQYYYIKAIFFRLSPNGFSPLHRKKILCVFDNAYMHVIGSTCIYTRFRES